MKSVTLQAGFFRCLRLMHFDPFTGVQFPLGLVVEAEGKVFSIRCSKYPGEDFLGPNRKRFLDWLLDSMDSCGKGKSSIEELIEEWKRTPEAKRIVPLDCPQVFIDTDQTFGPEWDYNVLAKSKLP